MSEEVLSKSTRSLILFDNFECFDSIKYFINIKNILIEAFTGVNIKKLDIFNNKKNNFNGLLSLTNLVESYYYVILQKNAIYNFIEIHTY